MKASMTRSVLWLLLAIGLCTSPAMAQTVDAAEQVSPETPAAPSAPAATTAPVAPSAPAAPSAPTELRRVSPGESLMSISREVAAARDVSLAQAMMGLYRTNPTAFVGGDMSQLLVGAELRIPPREVFTASSQAAAFREVQERLGIWGGASPSAPAAASRPPPVRPAPAPAATPPSAVTPAPEAEPETASPELSALQAEMDAQQARIAELETELEAARTELARLQAPLTRASMLLEQQLGNLWWLWGVLLALIALLAVLLRGQARRAEAAETEARNTEAALVRAHRELEQYRPAEESTAISAAAFVSAAAAVSAATSAPTPTFSPIAAPGPTADDSLLAEAASKINFDEVMSATAEDLEGDPPPIEEAGSMIDLARAYIEMGDHNAAMTELQLALKNGNEAQRAEALRLLDSLPKS